MERLNSDSSIAVSDTFAFVFIGAVLLFIGKTMYDLIKSKHLSSREKTNFAFIISLVPVIGSMLFYAYESNVYQNNRSKTTYFK